MENLKPLPYEDQYFLIMISNVQEEGQVIEDTMTITLDDGQEYSFHIVVTIIVDGMGLEIHDLEWNDENGKYTVRHNPPGSSENFSDVSIQAEYRKTKDFTVIVEIMDVGADADVSYRYTVSALPSPHDSRFPLTIHDDAISLDGNKIYIPITLVFRAFRLNVSVEKSADGLGTIESVTKVFSFGIGAPLSSSDDSDTTDDTNKPTTTPTPKEEKTAQQSANEAAEESALKSIESANKAMQAAAESGSAVSSSKVQTYTTAAGTSVPAVSVKLYGFDAGLSLEMMRTLAEGSTGLRVNLNNGAAQVLIPAGFDMPNIPGVLGYTLAYQKEPSWESSLMRALVNDPNALTETHRLGGGELPTSATVTLKTRLSGTVNIYFWDPNTRKATLLTSAAAQSGKVTFATKQLGNLIITTGTV